MVFLLGKMAWYVTPLGLPSTIAAEPNSPVVPGTGSVASARPAAKVAMRVEERIMSIWFMCC